MTYFIGSWSAGSTDRAFPEQGPYGPIHNPKSFDLFSVGQQADHISGLAPTAATVANLEFDKNATQNPSTKDRYVREEIKVAGSKKPNKYIGNW